MCLTLAVAACCVSHWVIIIILLLFFSFFLLFLYTQFTRSNKKAQRYLLGALEKLVGKRYPALLNRTSHILKACYDSDLVEEDVILAWHGGKVCIDKLSSPFVLQPAFPLALCM